MSDKGIIGVPSVKGIGGSLKDFGIGALGGIVFLLAYSLFGGLGVLAAPLLAGAMIKGSRGETLSLMAGFLLIAIGALSGGLSSSSSSSSDSGVM